MKTRTSLQLIRNATVVFNYAGKKFLIDPMLAEKAAYPGLLGTPNSHLRNPLTELPVPVEDLLDPDAVIVTHLHPDHWDIAAIEKLPKDLPVFSQNETDAKAIREAGFADVRIFTAATRFDDVTFQKTACQHGSDAAYAHPQVSEILGQASGLYFNTPGEKSVYFVGDSIWIEAIELNLKNLQPDIVVLNGGAAQLEGFGAIIMDKEDVLRVHQILPHATIIVIHMEALNHCLLSRKDLRHYVAGKNFAEQVIIPKDGQIIEF